jgi:hypothetical protein
MAIDGRMIIQKVSNKRRLEFGLVDHFVDQLPYKAGLVAGSQVLWYFCSNLCRSSPSG